MIRAKYALKYAWLFSKRMHIIMPLIVLYVLTTPEVLAVLVATSLWWWVTR